MTSIDGGSSIVMVNLDDARAASVTPPDRHDVGRHVGRLTYLFFLVPLDGIVAPLEQRLCCKLASRSRPQFFDPRHHLVALAVVRSSVRRKAVDRATERLVVAARATVTRTIDVGFEHE